VIGAIRMNGSFTFIQPVFHERTMTEVTCAVILEGERILATRRSTSMPHPLKWEFPGGKVRTGESPESCIRREIMEELGVTLRLVQPLPPVIHHYGTGPVKLIPFMCTIRKGTIRLREHMDFRWLLPGELDEPDWLDADVEVVRYLMERSGA